MAVVERLARPLRRLCPPAALALAVALVIRFVPVLSERAANCAGLACAVCPGGRGGALIVPVTLAALDDAEHAAEALRARGGVG